MSLKRPPLTESMESTLGHSWKTLDHRIGTELLVGLGVLDYVEAVVQENAAQKCVYQIDLHEHVDEVKDLTDHKVEEVRVVFLSVQLQVVHQHVNLVLSLVFGQHRTAQIADQTAQTAT